MQPEAEGPLLFSAKIVFISAKIILVGIAARAGGTMGVPPKGALESAGICFSSTAAGRERRE
jgi:hypothetical protein